MFALSRRRPTARSLVLLSLVVASFSAACGQKSPTEPTGTVETIEIVVGTGVEATSGRSVAVHYTGWLLDDSKPERKGTQFDSSIGFSPLAFRLGSRQVIAGFDQGIIGMRVGGRRRLIIPPSLAYGSSGSGSAIPPNATLVFDIELVAVQ